MHIPFISLKLREFLEKYNKITEDCFNNCVFSMSYRDALPEEVCAFSLLLFLLEIMYCYFFQISCIDTCINKMVATHTRLSRNFAETQQKKMKKTLASMKQ